MYDSVVDALTIPADTTITLYMGYTLTAADTAVTVNGSLTFDIRDGTINGNVAVNAGGAGYRTGFGKYRIQRIPYRCRKCVWRRLKTAFSTAGS